MSRPALSASRGIDIIELLAAFPDRSFSLSDIVRATGINVASCHSILSALCARGYLARSTANKTYKLGVSLIAVGHGAEKSQPMAVRAMEAADKLHADLKVGVLLCTTVGDELLALYGLDDPSGRNAGLHVGERLPLVAPFGAAFLAWASEEEIAAWFDRRSEPADGALVARLYRDIELIRDRGYQLYFSNGNASSTIGSLLADMASSNPMDNYKSTIRRMVNTFENHAAQPEEIDDDALYEASMIAAPIFDRDGRTAFNLGLGGFAEPLSGKTISRYAAKLTQACLDVMRADRTLGWKREHTIDKSG